MTYDEAIKKVESIVTELERTEALSMDVYKTKAQEAKKLLDFCEKELGTMADTLNHSSEK